MGTVIESTSPLVVQARPNRRTRNVVLAAADALALALATLAAEFFAVWLDVWPTEVNPTLAVIAPLLLIPAWLGMFAMARLYESDSVRIGTSTFDEIRTVMVVLFAGGFALIAILDVLRLGATTTTGGRSAPVIAMILAAVVLVPAFRGSARTWILPSLTPPSRALIVGSGQVASLVHAKLTSHPEFATEVVGFVDADASKVPGPVLGGRDDIAAVAETLGIDRVIVAFSDAGHEEVLDILRSLRRPDIQVSIVPRYFEGFTSHAVLDDLAGLPLVTLPPLRLGLAERAVKRAFDFVASSLALIVLAPLLLLIAVAVKIDSRGPMLFRQQRRGRHGSTFSILKFRTMHVGAEARRDEVRHLNGVDGPLFKIKTRDPRVTRVGNFLRRRSLDELPQLWNVVRGQMSLVGPRPFVLDEADEITGWGARRLEATPGITGLWQVLGRNDISFDEMVRLDYLYVTNWSLWWDLKILTKTVPIVLRRRGAY